MKYWIFDALKENKSFFLFIFLMFFFRSAVADWNEVPTGSMKPTILEGDRILVNKMAYDARLPFSDFSLLKLSDPKRDDIIIFNSKVANKRLVKRVIGIPGDVIALQENTLIVNGEALDYKEVSSTSRSVDKQESFLEKGHFIRTNKSGSTLSNFGPIEVPAEHYLVLGDNRDNSVDSRVIGFIPRSEILGRSKRVVLSLDYENFYIPRKDRFFHTL